MAYRNAPHSTTGVAPSVLFRGNTLRSRLELLKPQLRDTVNNKQADQAAFKKSGRQRNFQVGQTVSVRDYRGSQKWISGVIVLKTGPLSYQVKVGPDSIWKRHVDQLLQADTSQPVNLQHSPVPEYPGLPSVHTRATEITEPATPAPVPPAPTASSNGPAQCIGKPADAQVVTNSQCTMNSRYPIRILHAPDKLNL